MAKKKHGSKFTGDFLEEVVALLHEGPLWTVEKKARLAAVGSERGSVEIDILLRGYIAGYEVRFGIECKNWARKVEFAQINELIGKLDDVGIPRSHGIYVSASGYTKGALRRAAKEGIRPLEITGLNKDRLSSALAPAFRHSIYLVPEVELVQVFGDRANEQKVITTLRYTNPETGRSVTALDHLWKKWFFEEVPRELGLHDLRFEIPQDTGLFQPNEEVIPKTIFFGLRVRAAVVSVVGSMTDHGLRDAATKIVQKRRVSLDFEGAVKSTVRLLDTEEELATFLREHTEPSLTVGRIRLPRIIYQHLYWPPTIKAWQRARAIYSEGRVPTFEDVEGSNLLAAWDFLANPDDFEHINDDLVSFRIYP